jgi:hypothetical protein
MLLYKDLKWSITRFFYVLFSGQLLDYMNIYHGDIKKIIRLCMSEYIKLSYVTPTKPDYDLVTLNKTVSDLAKSHEIDRPAPPFDAEKTICETKTSEELDESPGITKGFPIEPGLEFSQSSKPAKLVEQESIPEEEILLALSGFSDLEVLNQISLLNWENESLSTADNHLTQLSQNVDKEPSEKLAVDEDRRKKNKSKVKKGPNSCKDYNIYTIMKNLADYLVADLPEEYQEVVKTAFSKIRGYNFPHDFINNSSTDKAPFFKILKERKCQEQIKAETDEVLNSFMSEINSINSILF